MAEIKKDETKEKVNEDTTITEVEDVVDFPEQTTFNEEDIENMNEEEGE